MRDDVTSAADRAQPAWAATVCSPPWRVAAAALGCGGGSLLCWYRVLAGVGGLGAFVAAIWLVGLALLLASEASQLAADRRASAGVDRRLRTGGASAPGRPALAPTGGRDAARRAA